MQTYAGETLQAIHPCLGDANAGLFPGMHSNRLCRVTCRAM
jgi:hypothetical protein